MRSIISRNFVFRFPAGRTPTPRRFAVNASALTTKGPARFLGVVRRDVTISHCSLTSPKRLTLAGASSDSGGHPLLRMLSRAGVTLRRNRSSVRVYFSFFSMDYICEKGARSIVRARSFGELESKIASRLTSRTLRCGARRCFYHYPNAEALGHSRSCKSVHKKGPR